MKLLTTEFQCELSTPLLNRCVIGMRLNLVFEQPVTTFDCSFRPKIAMVFDASISAQAELYLNKPMQYDEAPALFIVGGFNDYILSLEKCLPIKAETAFAQTDQIAIATFLSVIEVEVRRAIYACLSASRHR